MNDNCKKNSSDIKTTRSSCCDLTSNSRKDEWLRSRELSGTYQWLEQCRQHRHGCCQRQLLPGLQLLPLPKLPAAASVDGTASGQTPTANNYLTHLAHGTQLTNLVTLEIRVIPNNSTRIQYVRVLIVAMILD